MKRDYYEVLGVGKGATQEEIKRAYRRLARQYHPDVNSGDRAAADKFKEINEAYQVLSNEEKRSAYDRFGHAAFDQRSGGGAGNWGQDFDPFGDFTGFGDIFDMFFGTGSRTTRRGRRQAQRTKGSDISLEVTLDFEEAAFGVEKEVRFERDEICPECGGIGGSSKKSCPHCGGSGEVRHTQTSFFGSIVTARPCTYCGGRGWIPSDTCSTCRGTGKVRKKQNLKVKIPAGVDTGYRLRVNGEGEASPNGGPPGDLYLYLKVKPHPVLKRKGRDLWCEFELSYPQLVLGDEVEVPTLTGSEMVRVPPGTESESVLRLKGRGLPDPQTGARGDQLIKLRLSVPRRLSAEHRELLEKLWEIERSSSSGKGEATGRRGNGNGTIFGRLKEAFTHPEG
ncbi:MAG: molecular chaperone DnaJ [Candidatus Atribacteria bacterium]|nr:molecular chaperone DnaJ [Candidatus Atribacteria bacterium]